MPRIFDNIEHDFLPDLRQSLADSTHADFCVGYFRLRGWQRIASAIDHYDGKDGSCCRVLIGMHRAADEYMRRAQQLARGDERMGGTQRAKVLESTVADFKQQLEFGLPTAEAEAALRHLARQLRSHKARIKLFLEYPLHAKLYVVHREVHGVPLIDYIGSSNLTLAGLTGQGELNIDVVEQDAARKLADWFDARWDNPLCEDISEQLATMIESSWAREDLLAPYLVYLKMAYHLSADARVGETQFKLPEPFAGVLLDYQDKAVRLVCRKLYRHGGVLLADVVGLGKTMMAAAVAKTFQEDDRSSTLIICPPKLETMWHGYRRKYGLHAEILSLGKVVEKLPDMPAHRTLIIDESHNLRNRGGQRYRAIKEYIDAHEPRVVLLTATPYNKEYSDLSNQLRLFIEEDQDLGVRPNRYIKWWCGERPGRSETDLYAETHCVLSTLRAFELSDFPEDWRDLMQPFLVRRTREYIIKTYADFDPARERYYVMRGGERYYFPLREPKRIEFKSTGPTDQYERLFSDDVVKVVERLVLPRYGLHPFLVPDAAKLADQAQKQVIDNLNKAGKRLIGFSRTNLLKRLESCGHSFLLSVRRHIVRNCVFLHALDNNLPLPIGTQSPVMLDPAISDSDETAASDDDDTAADDRAAEVARDLKQHAADVYRFYAEDWRNRFDWLDARFFKPELADRLRSDNEQLLQVMREAGEWNPEGDMKLAELEQLARRQQVDEKLLVFTQFADTAIYLHDQLKKRGITEMAVATNQAGDPVKLARRFSPTPNGGLRGDETELNVLIATDVLAEGQNLQDCHTVVNYDIPWAIVRLVQRVGRVDRIGQQHDTIRAYSFWPHDGVERYIKLRERILYRLRVNQEVIGTDESFFGEEAKNRLVNLYAEDSESLNAPDDGDAVDWSSQAQSVWDKAPEELKKQVEELPPVVYATRAHLPETAAPAGAIVFVRYERGKEKYDSLVRVDERGSVLPHSMPDIFRAAKCEPDTPALQPQRNHHELVKAAVRHTAGELRVAGGQLGNLRSISRKVNDRLKAYRQVLRARPSLFTPDDVGQVDTILDQLFAHPLKDRARESLSRQLKIGITDSGLLAMAWQLHEDGRLCEEAESELPTEPQILCSLGLKPE